MLTADGLPEYVGVAKASEILCQKRSNVAKFLEARPWIRTAQGPAGQQWRVEDVRRAKEMYDEDEVKRNADARRRAAALGSPVVQQPQKRQGRKRVAIGPTQRALMERMVEQRRITSAELRSDGERMALSRLVSRGFARSLDGRPRRYELTSDGRKVAKELGKSEHH